MSSGTLDAEEVIDRLRKLEIKHRNLSAFCVLLTIATVVIPLLLTRSFATAVSTNAVIVPSGPAHVKAGVAASRGGQEIAVWLAQTVRGEQTRLTLAEDGTQFLTFADRSGAVRVRLGIDAASVPHLELLEKDGRVLWSADVPRESGPAH